MKYVIVLVHAFVGWALCAATMGIGLATLPLQTALIIHAIAAPSSLRACRCPILGNSTTSHLSKQRSYSSAL
jgi:hypothetical protein